MAGVRIAVMAIVLAACASAEVWVKWVHVISPGSSVVALFHAPCAPSRDSPPVLGLILSIPKDARRPARIKLQPVDEGALPRTVLCGPQSPEGASLQAALGDPGLYLIVVTSGDDAGLRVRYMARMRSPEFVVEEMDNNGRFGGTTLLPARPAAIAASLPYYSHAQVVIARVSAAEAAEAFCSVLLPGKPTHPERLRLSEDCSP